MSQREVAAWLREAAKAFREHYGLRRHLRVVIQDVEDPAAAVVFSVPPESMKDQSDRIAAALAAAGVRCSGRVALLLPNCPELVFSYLACFKLGAVGVPLNSTRSS